MSDIVRTLANVLAGEQRFEVVCERWLRQAVLELGSLKDEVRGLKDEAQSLRTERDALTEGLSRIGFAYFAKSSGQLCLTDEKNSRLPHVFPVYGPAPQANEQEQADDR